MKNDFKHNDDGTTTIYINRKDKPILETIISTSDFDNVNNFPNTWFSNLHISGNYRIMGELPKENGKRKVVYLHRWVMDFPEGKEVDHINMDQLDNRRENLRVVTRDENIQNRGSNKGSSTPYRNVIWDKSRNKFRVEIRVNSKVIYIGRFDDIEKANKAAIEARKNHMPYSNN